MALLAILPFGFRMYRYTVVKTPQKLAGIWGYTPRVAADQLAPILNNHPFKPVLSFQGATFNRSSMPGMATRVQRMKNWV